MTDVQAKDRKPGEPPARLRVAIPSECWIVSSHKFREHGTEAGAQAETERLRAEFPQKTFRIYRVKRTLKQNGAGPIIRSLQDALGGMIRMAEAEAAIKHDLDCMKIVGAAKAVLAASEG